MTLKEFNALSKDQAKQELFRCCGCTKWADELMEHFPFTTIVDMKLISDKIWFKCSEQDWLEAFSHHPKIGEQPGEQHTSTASWATVEQAGVKTAGEKIKSELIRLNTEYEKKFGYIFIIHATGKSVEEILHILRERIPNNPDKEFHIASGEQNKITHLRIDKLLS